MAKKKITEHIEEKKVKLRAPTKLMQKSWP